MHNQPILPLLLQLPCSAFSTPLPTSTYEKGTDGGMSPRFLGASNVSIAADLLALICPGPVYLKTQQITAGAAIPAELCKQYGIPFGSRWGPSEATVIPLPVIVTPVLSTYASQQIDVSFKLRWVQSGVAQLCNWMTCACQVVYDHEGESPEGTPLSRRLCERLGVPEGTIWGLPAGQRRYQQLDQGSASPQQSPPPARSAPPSKSLEV